MKKIYLFFIFALLACGLYAQSNKHKSITKLQKEFYAKYHFTKHSQWDSLYADEHPNLKGYQPKPKRPETACTLNKRVFGWMPNWTSTQQENDLDLSLLSDIAYGEYDVDPSTGNYTDIYAWTSDPLITKALASGVKVELMAQILTGSDVTTFLSSTTAENKFITTIINLVNARHANGVNIDFEEAPSSDETAMTSFLQRICDSVHTRIPNGQLTIAAPAFLSGSPFNVTALSSYVDLWVIMGYDYYWGTAPDAGPCSPLTSAGLWSDGDCTSSVVNYLASGCPNNKLALGVPYYGYQWPTSSAGVDVTTTGAGGAVLYNTAAANFKTYGRKWDNYSMTPWYTYGTYQEGWCDDYVSLGYKYDMVNIENIAGIGIWALGYDDGLTTAWNTIQDHFTNCDTIPCKGEFCDLGDTGNYYNNEDWTYTIAPFNSSNVSMTFSSFKTTAGDNLLIYNGNSTSSPLIGTYSGSSGPGTVTGTTGSLTFHFSSSAGGTTSSGWKALWSCTIGPSADFTASKTTVCPGTTVNFTDQSTSPGTITAWKWTFTGGSPSSSTLQNPGIVYNTPGTYSVKEVMFSSAGNDSITKTSYITVSSVSALPLVETFQSDTFPPKGWVLNLPNPNDSVWALCSFTGYNSSQCMFFPGNCGNANNITGERQQIYTPNYSFVGAVKPKMWFDVAYEPYNKIYSDTLAIYYSPDCGNTWTNIYLKGGMTLCSTGKYDSTGTDTGSVLGATGCFIPPNSSAWRVDSINLSSLAGDADVMFSFEDRSGWGNIIYIDNINVQSSSVTSIENLTEDNHVKIFPNPFRQSFTVEYNLPKEEPVSIYMIDIFGRKIPVHLSDNEAAGQHSAAIDCNSPGLAKGMYVIEVQTSNGNSFFKVIKE
ncbi:MAG: glycosyl hydrolase family 18 protein [Bacteroidia bacterium]